MENVIIAGRLGKDPEIKYFDNGKVKTEFSIAVDRYDSVKKEKFTSWFNITAWEKLAEFAGEHLKKGTNCVVNGVIKSEEYQSKMYHKVTANDIKFSNAYITLYGEVEKLEERFTQNNKKIQTFKIKEKDFIINNSNDKNQVADNDVINILGTLTIKDNQKIIKALKIDCSSSDDNRDEIVKFGENDIDLIVNS